MLKGRLKEVGLTLSLLSLHLQILNDCLTSDLNLQSGPVFHAPCLVAVSLLTLREGSKSGILQAKIFAYAELGGGRLGIF